MEYTKIDSHIQNTLQDYIQQYKIQPIIDTFNKAGATVLLVGGAVRDLLLGLPLKDLDIEIHGLLSDEVEKILRTFGPVSVVGKAYGVFRIHGIDIDWSLPRTDAQGRKPHVTVDPHMNVAQAFVRRDVTINAMGINLVTYELIDPFDGLQDLQAGVLRAPDETKFVEDPLRFFRVMQFVARFGFTPTDELNALCASMDINDVSRERIEQEFAKAFLRSSTPSRAFRWLASINRLSDVVPEVAALRGVQQDPRWHPEGDVFEHTMQAVDAAARQAYENDHKRLIGIYAALCHDLGKVSTTVIHDDGKITSYDHEQESARLASQLLKRITHNKDIIDPVVKLARYHMQPSALVKQDAGLNAYKRLAKKLAPDVTMKMLADLVRADKQARNPQGHEPLHDDVEKAAVFLQRAEQAGVVVQEEKPVLQGRDIADIVQPGPDMGAFLKMAYDIQIEEGITDKEELKKRVMKNLS